MPLLPKNKKIASKIFSHLSTSRQILLSFHPSPDGDSVGSNLAFYHYLISLGKKVVLIKGDSEIKTKYSPLPQFDKVVNKNISEINMSDFDTFVILDSQDLTRVSKLFAVHFPDHLITINIDHHDKNDEFADYNLIEPGKSSTAEIIYDLLTFKKVPISQDIASCLYFGIYDDSLGFSIPATNSHTLSAAAALARLNPQFNQAVIAYKNSAHPGELRYTGLSLINTTEHFNGMVGISSLSINNQKKYNIAKYNQKKAAVADILNTVKNWVFSVSITEAEKGFCIISLRSKDLRWDCSKIAKALNGGGHPNSSGASVKAGVIKSKKILLDTIKNIYPQLGSP